MIQTYQTASGFVSNYLLISAPQSTVHVSILVKKILHATAKVHNHNDDEALLTVTVGIQPNSDGCLPILNSVQFLFFKILKASLQSFVLLL